MLSWKLLRYTMERCEMLMIYGTDLRDKRNTVIWAPKATTDPLCIQAGSYFKEEFFRHQAIDAVEMRAIFVVFLNLAQVCFDNFDARGLSLSKEGLEVRR